MCRAITVCLSAGLCVAMLCRRSAADDAGGLIDPDKLHRVATTLENYLSRIGTIRCIYTQTQYKTLNGSIDSVNERTRTDLRLNLTDGRFRMRTSKQSRTLDGGFEDGLDVESVYDGREQTSLSSETKDARIDQTTEPKPTQQIQVLRSIGRVRSIRSHVFMRHL